MHVRNHDHAQQDPGARRAASRDRHGGRLHAAGRGSVAGAARRGGVADLQESRRALRRRHHRRDPRAGRAARALGRLGAHQLPHRSAGAHGAHRSRRDGHGVRRAQHGGEDDRRCRPHARARERDDAGRRRLSRRRSGVARLGAGHRRLRLPGGLLRLRPPVEHLPTATASTPRASRRRGSTAPSVRPPRARR